MDDDTFRDSNAGTLKSFTTLPTRDTIFGSSMPAGAPILDPATPTTIVQGFHIVSSILISDIYESVLSHIYKNGRVEFQFTLFPYLV